MNIENFETYLRQGNMAENTVAAYLYAVREYYSRHKELNKRNLLVYKTYLIEKFKPKTVNLRIQAMNKYLDCMGKSRLRLKSVKVQQRSYLENVISNADYVFLKNKLKKEENQEWYFVVRFLAATGARVSELIQMKVEHYCRWAISTSTPKAERYAVSTFRRLCARKLQSGLAMPIAPQAIFSSIALENVSRPEVLLNS